MDAYESGDQAEFLHAVGIAARAKGLAEIARAVGLGRESLHEALAEGANPSFATVDKVLRALGVKLAIAALHPEETVPDFKSLLLSIPSGKKLFPRRRGL